MTQRLIQTFDELCRTFYVRGAQLLEKYALVILFLVGVALVIGGVAKMAHADPLENVISNVVNGSNVEERIYDGIERQIIQGLNGGQQTTAPLDPNQVDEVYYRKIQCGTGFFYQVLHGSLGAILLIGAGISTIIATWVGKYEVAISMLVFIVGCQILQPMTQIMFGTDYSTVPDLMPVDAKCE